MPFTSYLTRAKTLTFSALVATIICSALAASPLFDSSRAAARQSLDETVQIFSGDCSTPQNVFYLGDVICVRAGEFPAAPDAAEYYRRISYAAPNLDVVQTSAVWKDPEFDRFQIPDTGDHAMPGTWRVHTVDIETNARAVAKFTVRHPLTRYTDLYVWKRGPDVVLPGDKVIHQFAVKNTGPDSAISIQLTEQVPTYAYFYALKQTGGSLFECSTPAQWESGEITCKGRGLKPDESATFDVYYIIDERARPGETSEGTTSAFSETSELHKLDNFAAHSVAISDPESNELPPPEEP